jgi:hypothetical protein
LFLSIILFLFFYFCSIKCCLFCFYSVCLSVVVVFVVVVAVAVVVIVVGGVHCCCSRAGISVDVADITQAVEAGVVQFLTQLITTQPLVPVNGQLVRLHGVCSFFFLFVSFWEISFVYDLSVCVSLSSFGLSVS